ncbi:hypothetical protein NQZ68_020367 [Dissostichus eleginoides]|nr:hypothetical protein NQZ68_020367 [Dissostichus eleginoides]
MAGRGRDGGGSGEWEQERGTAGLLLSGLKSLGAPASKQSRSVSGGQTPSGHDFHCLKAAAPDSQGPRHSRTASPGRRFN